MLKEFFKKLDMKSWVILMMSLLLLVFFLKDQNKPSDWKSSTKKIEKEIKDLQRTRDSISEVSEINQRKVKELESNIKYKDDEIKLLNDKISKQDNLITIAKDSIKKQKDKISRNNLEIKKLESKPLKRTGSELLESLKNKTSK